MDADGVMQLLGQAFEEAPVALSVLDATGRQIMANRRYQELLGLDAESLNGLTVIDITVADDAEWTASYLDRLARGELAEFRTEKTYRRPDGSTVRCELITRALRDDVGACRAFIGAIRPVEQPQVATDGRLRRFIQHVDDAITLVDAEGSVIETTGRYTTVLGYPSEFWERRSIFDLLAPEEVERAISLHARLLDGTIDEVVGEFRVVASDGHHEYIALRAVNLLDDPSVRGIVVSSRNVSDERRLREELEQARDAANELAAARTQLIATVSHELRNPLHAVSGLAELLAQDDLPEHARPLAASLARQLAALSTVTGDLLDATRSELGMIELRPVPVRLSEMIDDTVAVAVASIGARPIDVHVEIDPALPAWLLLDRDRLGQMLGNLVGNAVKFTDRGRIDVTARRDVTGRLLLEVADTGVGIPAVDLDRILEPFATASTGSARRGAGLGLSVVRHLVEAMRGSIRVESEVGRGSSFAITLPLVESQAPEPTATPITPPTALRVLVVEDDPVNQQLARAQLERLGHVPIVVGSGESALELLGTGGVGPVDVVLMDEQLPGMNGTETARAIRTRGLVDPGVRMISVTASAAQGRRDEFLAAGMDELLSKPLSLATLGRALESDPAPSTGRADIGGADVGGADVVARSGTPDVDVEALTILVAELGDLGSVRSLVGTFLHELPGRLTIITDEAMDPARRAGSAHTLGSGAAMLGAPALTAVCRAIERGEPIPAELPALCDRVAADLDAWLDSTA